MCFGTRGIRKHNQSWARFDSGAWPSRAKELLAKCLAQARLGPKITRNTHQGIEKHTKAFFLFGAKKKTRTTCETHMQPITSDLECLPATGLLDPSRKPKLLGGHGDQGEPRSDLTALGRPNKDFLEPPHTANMVGASLNLHILYV